MSRKRSQPFYPGADLGQVSSGGFQTKRALLTAQQNAASYRDQLVGFTALSRVTIETLRREAPGIR